MTPLQEAGNLLADLLETSLIEVSDIIGDFHENLVSNVGIAETVRLAAQTRDALEKLGAMRLVDNILQDPKARKRIVEVLAYTISSLESWVPEEEIEEEEEDLF